MYQGFPATEEWQVIVQKDYPGYKIAQESNKFFRRKIECFYRE